MIHKLIFTSNQIDTYSNRAAKPTLPSTHLGLGQVIARTTLQRLAMADGVHIRISLTLQAMMVEDNGVVLVLSEEAAEGECAQQVLEPSFLFLLVCLQMNQIYDKNMWNYSGRKIVRTKI